MSENDEESKDFAAEYIWRMMDKTVAMEESRYESLRRMCDGLLVASSIVSVALLTVAEPLFDFFSSNVCILYTLLSFYALTILLLLVSMVLTVVSMTRFKYVATDSPTAICNAICSFGDTLTNIGAAKSFAEVQEKLYQGFFERNNRMKTLLVAAQWLLVAALAIIAVGGIILLAGGFVMLGK